MPARLMVGEKGGPRWAPSSSSMGLEPRKEVAVLKLLQELRDELHGAALRSEGSPGAPLWGNKPEAQGKVQHPGKLLQQTH